jgi:hypothetical protein
MLDRCRSVPYGLTDQTRILRLRKSLVQLLAWGNRIHASAHQNHLDPKAAKRTGGQEEGAASAKKNGSICVARERGLLKLPSPFYSALLSALLML